ncbi:hypothetical protein ACTOB_001371 [Actinoplanes oblitus]|uniref:Uncharacterized protein n=1 Tax=Actinoplanes oblitus TaxID=3040509 RepID=A0ABY8WK86_9ACTN|nr:hypothetical protein [Actinoplanes oblitus]WIM97817.1 hypothetical protein ACTOB_001371 [Actinoplanes oblitus]
MFGLGKRREVVMQTIVPPHEPSADARRAAVLEERIAAAGRRIHVALQAQSRLEADDRNDELLDLAWDLQLDLCLRAPGSAEPPVTPGRS